MARKKVSDDELLEAIAQYVEENGYSPTVRDLCGIVGLSSTSTMHFRLKSLRERGLVTFDPVVSRTIKVVGK